MNNLILNNEIANRIYEIRGVKVMLDSDLAKLFECKNGTKEINQAVSRNLNKFPIDYSWILTDDEIKELWSQNVTANISNMSRSNPRVFTESGIYMLSTILRSDIAVNTTILIIEAFTMMKNYISNNLLSQKYYNDMVIKHNNEIKLLKETLNNFKNKKIESKTFYKGEIYDAYSSLMDIFNSANKELIIVDNYVDKTLLDIIRELEVNVVIITKKDKKRDILINKYLSQYNNLKVMYSDKFHDRYFVIDKSEIYYCGTSINGIGKSVFSIALMGDNDLKNFIINLINNKINN